MQEDNTTLGQKIIEEHLLEKEAAKTIGESASSSKTEEIDLYFESLGFKIEKPSETYQFERASYRRLSKNNKQWVVAYKTDWKLYETHRVFIETWSTWKSTKHGEPGVGKKGWALDRRFDAIIIYSPQSNYFWWIPQHRLEEHIPKWKTIYDTHEITNKDWITLGHAIPEDEISLIGRKGYIEN